MKKIFFPITIIALSLNASFASAKSIPGITEPINTVKITTKVQGTITQYNKEIGESVFHNEVLVKIDDIKFKLQKKLVEAELSQLKIEKSHYLKKLKRYENLLKNNNASESEYEDILFQYNLSDNKIKQKEISLSEINDDLNNTTIYGREGFLVSKRSIEEGEYVQASKELYEIIDTRKLNVNIQVSDKELNSFNVGQIVKVVVDNMSYDGIVKYKGVSMEEDTYAYPIIIEINNIDNIPVQKTVFVEYEVR